jgi:Flp pilus assembly protein TadD
MGEHLKKIEASKRPLGIAHVELEATIAARKGDPKKAWALFRQAADRQAALLYTEPPDYPRPVAEGWGYAALARRDYPTAEMAYREALTREPGGGRALFGLAAALQGQGRMAAAETALGQARKAWDKADLDLPQTRGTARAEASDKN